MELITIIFIGLIAHVTTTSGVETAVLMNAADHVPQMMIYHANGNTDGPFALADTYVTISTATSSATTKMLVTDSVPELKDIGKCTTLIDTVDKRTEDALVESYIDHAGGQLIPLAFQEEMIDFQGATEWTDTRCAACGTQLVLPVDKGTTATINLASIKDKGNPYATLKIKRSDIVVVRNAPPPGSGPTGIDHFPHFYELFTDCTNKVKVSVKTACKAISRCEDIDPRAVPLNLPAGLMKTSLNFTAESRANLRFDKASFRAFIVTPSVECTNSQYP